MKRLNIYSTLVILAAVFMAACNGAASTNEQGNANNWKMGVALYSFNNLSFADALAKVDSGKIKYVEGFSFYKLGGAYGDTTMGDLPKESIAQMKQAMKDRDVKMVSMYVGGGNNVEEWKRTFEMAKEFELEYVTCEPLKAHWDMIDSLAGVYNIKVALHNHWKEISIYWHPDSLLEAFKTHPNFGACADIGHWVRSGLDPAECLQKLDGHILGMHLKDVDKVGMADKTADITVGQGVIAFKPVVAELQRQDYKGMIFVECEHNFGYNLPDVLSAINYIDTLNVQ